MSFGVEQHGQHRRLLVALVLAVLALVVGVGVGVDAHASSSGGQVGGTRVAAHDLLAGPVVAASEDIAAGEGRRTTTRAPDDATGLRVAPRATSAASEARFVVNSAGEVADLHVGARFQPIDYTRPGELFVRVGARAENLNFTFETPGGMRAGTYAFPEDAFTRLGYDPARIQDLADLPGAPPSVYRFLEPPPGTPIQRGIVPGFQFGGRGGIPEVYFPKGF